MIIDHIQKKSKNKQIIEIFVDGIWIPAMATDLRILNRELDFKRVTEIRVRNLVSKTKAV